MCYVTARTVQLQIVPICTCMYRVHTQYQRFKDALGASRLLAVPELVLQRDVLRRRCVSVAVALIVPIYCRYRICTEFKCFKDALKMMQNL